MIRSAIFLVWVFLSTILYAVLVIAISPLSIRTSRWIAWKWSEHLLWVGGVRVHTRGLESLTSGRRYLVASNHASAFDIPILMAALPLTLLFMAKKELFSIPVFGWGIRVIGHIPIDRGSARKALQSIKTAAERIHNEPVSLLLFPEGTRSETGELGEFKAGSFALALAAGVEVVPVFIGGAHRILVKKSLWLRPGSVDVLVGRPVRIDGSMDKKSLARRIQTEVVELKRMYDGQGDRV